MSLAGVSLRDVVAQTINISGIQVGPAGEELFERLIEKLIATLDASGVLAASELAGLQRRTVVSLAVRLRPDVLGFEQAITELERAVEIALEVIARGERGTYEDVFVNDVLARIAERIRQDDPDGGARVIDSALAELEAQRQEFEATLQRKELLLLKEGIRVDTLRRDVGAVARRVEHIVVLANPGTDRPAWHPGFRAQYDTYMEDGEQRGIGFSLAVAIELARRMLATTRSADERSSALNLLGNALGTLGERETGTERLHEAIRAYRSALKERTRKRAPLVWAGTQTNLGITLRILGDREASTELLLEAIQAFQAALKEHTRERAPLAWAMIQNNLGNALQTLGGREAGTERLHEAIRAFRAALEERTRERAPLAWAMIQNNLGAVLQTLGDREASTELLLEAIQAFQAALKERTREGTPLAWAKTQNNLGAALAMLGEHESGTERLLEAVQVFRVTLQELTRERVPLAWASTQNNLGKALHILGQRKAEAKHLRDAVEAYDLCLEVIEGIWPHNQIKEVHLSRMQSEFELKKFYGS